MKNLKTYLLLAGIILAFILGLFSGSGKDAERELQERYKAERKLILDQITKKQVEIYKLNQAQKAIEARRVQDSLQFAGALERNQTAYNRLKKKYNEINLNRADAHLLDSIVSELFPD